MCKDNISALLSLSLLLVGSLFVLTACGDDDIASETVGVVNNNANPKTARAECQRLEFPHVSGNSTDLIVVHSTPDFGVNYSIEWDCMKRAQRWTCYQMYNANSVGGWNRNNWYSTSWGGDPFQPDPDIPSEFNVALADHRSNGFDRGHICPSADRLCSRDANEQTFYLSNMHPQYHAFNSGLWEKMEKQVRTWNRSNFRDTLYVCKGGVIDRDLLLTTAAGLPVPGYFFMAILCKNSKEYKAIGFWAPHLSVDHSGDALIDYAVSIDRLEELTGLDFFCNLPDNEEKLVESVVTPIAWGLK